MSRLKPYWAYFLLYFCFISIYLFLEISFGIFHQPYLWDELGVYARAATRMYHDGLSLLPNAIPDELSRGHPLLSTFYFALAFKLFGCNPFVAHIAAAILNMLNFHILFLILKRYMSQVTALTGTLICFLQPAFLAQSVLVLPEMPLMLFTTLCIYAFLENKSILLSLAVTCALLTKESAIIIPFALLPADLYRKNFKPDWGFFVKAFAIPVTVILLFFYIQYLQRGYFFYPLHTSLLKFEWYFIKERWDGLSRFLFVSQAHWLWLSILIISMLFKYRSILDLPKELIIMMTVIIAGTGFQCLNYFLSRYNLFILLPFLAFIWILFYKTFSDNKYLFGIISICLMFSSFYYLKGRNNYTDVDFSYVPHLENLEATVKELNSGNYTGKRIQLGFPLAACYFDKENGYGRESEFSILLENSDTADFKVFTLPGNMEDTSKLSSHYSLYKTLNNGRAYSKIYIKKLAPESLKDQI